MGKRFIPDCIGWYPCGWCCSTMGANTCQDEAANHSCCLLYRRLPLSLTPKPLPPVCNELTRLAHVAFPRGNGLIQIREVLGSLDANPLPCGQRPLQPSALPSSMPVCSYASSVINKVLSPSARVGWVKMP